MALFQIPVGTRESRCRTCSAPIFWIVTPRGKRMPANADGTSHFSTCRDADLRRRAPTESLIVRQFDSPIEEGHFKAYRRSDGKIAITDDRRPLADRTVRLVMTEEAAEKAVRELAGEVSP